jgi:AmmeMemoRadiSam system protein B
MSTPHRPRLREHLELLPRDSRRQRFLLRDRLRLSPVEVRLSATEAGWLDLFNGQRTLEEIRQLASSEAWFPIPLERITELATQLNASLFLDGEPFQRMLHAPVRPPCCLDVYPPEPGELREMLRALFSGAGLPDEARPDPALRAVLLPHMDYHRGARVYASGFRSLFERNAARLFVIIATSHHSSARFTLTRKHFQTPLGVVETDQPFIDRLVAAHGDGLFDDEALAHFPEHSIELEVVLLQYLYPRTPFRIVPLLVGSFNDCIRRWQDPLQVPDIARMIAALQEAERQTPEPICYLISGDLAHIGPKFGDPPPLEDHQLRHSAGRDRSLLEQISAADPEEYFQLVAQEKDERRICGLSPTYLALAATRPASGRVLAFEQCVARDRSESVSFAAATFDRG